MDFPNNHQHDGETAGAGVSALVRMVGLFFGGLRVLLVIMLAYLVFGGIFYVEQDKAAMLFRFGRLVQKDGQDVLRSGTWYWAFPYPIDRVEKVPAARSITITTKQFWPQTDPNQPQQEQVASSAIRPLAPGTDGYLLTGDANILHMAWTMTYRVSDVKRYYLAFHQDEPDAAGQPPPKGDRRGIDAVIEAALADAVLSEVAARTVEDALFLARSPEAAALLAEGQAPREPLIAAVRRRVTARLDALKAGIEVQQVSLAEVQPPLCTQPAFRDVLAAATDKQTEIDRMLAREKRIISEAEGQAAKVLADARAYRTRTVESVKAASLYFDKVLAEYRRSPRTMLISLYADAIRDVMNRAETKYVVHSRGDGNAEVRIQLGPEPEKPKPAGP